VCTNTKLYSTIVKQDVSDKISGRSCLQPSLVGLGARIAALRCAVCLHHPLPLPTQSNSGVVERGFQRVLRRCATPSVVRIHSLLTPQNFTLFYLGLEYSLDVGIRKLKLARFPNIKCLSILTRFLTNTSYILYSTSLYTYNHSYAAFAP
jgi:hypothetical protein